MIGCHGNQRGKFGGKINSLEAIRGIKLNLCRDVHSISHYKNIVFITVAYVLWLLWQLEVSIDLGPNIHGHIGSENRLIIGKLKIGFNCSPLQVF